jgi:hypothetical protein
MVAERHDIHAVAPDFVEQVGGDAAPAGDVLGIGDHQIDIPLADEAGEFLMKNLATGPTDNIAQTKNAKGHGDKDTGARRLEVDDAEEISKFEED